MSHERVEMTAQITAKPGAEAQLKARLRNVVALTVLEPGCLEFRVFEDLENPARFVLWEVFESAAALQLHASMDYTREYFASGLVERTAVTRQRLL